MPVYDCTLWQLLKKWEKESKNPEKQKFSILKKILEVVVFIHKRGFCHLDIKPSNVMLNLNSDGFWNERDLVLCDFGLSTDASNPDGNAGSE